jgi:hypothetical protein
MKTTYSTAARLVGAALGAVILSAGIPSSGLSEPADAVARPAKTSVAPQRSQTSGAAETRGRAWSIEDALPSRSSAVSAPARTPQSTPELGRIPLKSGTLGVETKSQINPYELPEGRRIPGLEATTHNPPSYLGFSLSVPTSDKSFAAPVAGPQPGSGRTD